MPIFFSLLFLLTPLFAAFPPETSSRILYLVHHNQIEEALAHYLECSQEREEHDFDLLQQVGQTILERGTQSADPEVQLFCLFGAGVALSPHLIPILERGIKSSEMKNQLIALNFLSRYQDDVADSLLIEALSSPHLLTRLEACYQLAQKRNPIIVDHLSALYYKVPPIVRTLFPQIIICIDSQEANQMMLHYLSDKDIVVRSEALVNVAKHKRDDFLPQVHTLAKQAHFIQQEAAALCFQEMQDRSALPLLQQLALSKQEEVKLAALVALYHLGEESILSDLFAEAKNGNLFVISALGDIETNESQELLFHLSRSENRDIALNASLSLLKQHQKAPYLSTLLFSETKDVGFHRLSSPAGALVAWKTVGSATQKNKNLQGLMAQTNGLKEAILIQAMELPEEDFLDLGRLIFEKNEVSLIPTLVTLLCNHRSAASIELLKEMQQKTGAPFVRNYCNLALFRLGEKGNMEEKLIEAIKKEQNNRLIQLREEKAKERQTQFSISAEEGSRFFIEALEALCSSQSLKGVETLIHTIAYGNPKNRYALAGLLIRTTE